MAKEPGILFGVQARGGVRPRGQGAPDAPRDSPRVQEHDQNQVFAQVRLIRQRVTLQVICRKFEMLHS